jgi:hypothetical protein
MMLNVQHRTGGRPTLQRLERKRAIEGQKLHANIQANQGTLSGIMQIWFNPFHTLRRTIK